MGETRGSQALTRESIELEIAMRLVIKGASPRKAWETAQAFVSEMDQRLPELPEPVSDGQPKPKSELLAGHLSRLKKRMAAE